MHYAHTLPTLTHADAEEILREPVFSVTPLGQGARARVYRVESEEGAVRVLRVSSRDTSRAAREAYVYERFRESGCLDQVVVLPAIRVQHGALAQRFEVVSQREVRGQPLGAALRGLLPRDQDHYFAAMGRGLAVVHGHTVTRAGLLQGGEGSFVRWTQCFETMADDALEALRISPLASLVDPARATLTRLRGSLVEPPSLRLLHGDAQPMNVLVHAGKIVAWLDWEFAMGGDPLFELAYVETLFESGWASWATEVQRASWREYFCRGYGDDPLARVPAIALQYALVHALRATEFSSVMAPSLAPALRLASERGMRSRIESIMGRAAQG
ncbi:MAG: aminoglycoside phosphotransferase family protein [Deltaproteobacteria bacterium]|nr:aminoglycoside phosphotransferase family protein [Deltaproteobacteria bacterium]